MRTWRVGTFSMGVSLLFLGIALLISQFIDISINSILTGWWPFIFVVLGIEILLYIWLQKTGKEMLKYDILSIFLIGFLGTVGLSFMILSQVGATDYVERMFSREIVTLELPIYDKEISDINRIVIENGGNSPLTIEATTSSDISVFGTYSGEIYKKEEPVDSVDDYLITTIKGDTLYLTLKKPTLDSGPFPAYLSMETTVLVPENVKLEVMGDYGQIILKPRTMVGDWTIMDTHEVTLFIEEKSQVDMKAVVIQEVSSNIKELKIEENPRENGFIEKNVSWENSVSTHLIQILNTDYLKVHQTP